MPTRRFAADWKGSVAPGKRGAQQAMMTRHSRDADERRRQKFRNMSKYCVGWGLNSTHLLTQWCEISLRGTTGRTIRFWQTDRPTRYVWKHEYNNSVENLRAGAQSDVYENVAVKAFWRGEQWNVGLLHWLASSPEHILALRWRAKHTAWHQGRVFRGEGSWSLASVVPSHHRCLYAILWLKWIGLMN